MSTSPGVVIAAGSGLPGSDWAPLLAGRGLVDEQPAAYVCRGFVCERPVATAEDLRAALERLER
jgi:uncharacterized protein YyaL (SSP411 family)